MPPTSDELALHEALHDLTEGQPAQPTDRVTSIRRRHVRRRAIQSAGGALVAAVAVVAALLVSGTVGHGAAEPVNRPVPSWALPWPDHRDGSVPQSVLDGAVAAWRSDNHTHPTRPEPREVIWYVGQKVADGYEGDDAVAVVFEIDTGTEHRLVAGVTSVLNAAATPLVNGQRGLLPVDGLYDVPAPPPDYSGYIGLNYAVPKAGGFHAGGLILTPPEDLRLDVAGVGERSLANGLVTFDAGLVRAPVQVKLTRPDGSLIADGAVGVPGAPLSREPLLAKVAGLTGVPPGGESLGEISGQGMESVYNASPSTGPTTIYARCYGPTPIRVAVDDTRTGVGVRIPCDDRQHEVTGPRVKQPSAVVPDGKGHEFTVEGGPFVSWRVEVVVHPSS